MSEEAAAEGLQVRIGGHPIALSSANPLKLVFGTVFSLLGALPGARLYAEYGAPRHLQLAQVSLICPTLPPGLAGLRIGFMSDVHYEPERPLALLARGVQLLTDAAPDLMLLGGDYTNSVARGFERPAALLGRLRAPLGVYAVLGNHDYWAGGDHIAAQLMRQGITVLRNVSRRLQAPDGTPFWLVGTDSAARRHDYLPDALACIPPGAFRLLLAHEPEIADRVLATGARVDLQLSGHTHGGQAVFPLLGAPLLPRLGRKYVSGVHPDPLVYTSRGLGTVPPYVRINCPPEVTILTLIPGAAAQ